MNTPVHIMCSLTTEDLTGDPVLNSIYLLYLLKCGFSRRGIILFKFLQKKLH